VATARRALGEDAFAAARAAGANASLAMDPVVSEGQLVHAEKR
jgi:hypothetical protein